MAERHKFREFKNYLSQNEKIRQQLKKDKNHYFFVSDEPYNLKILSKLSLSKEINPRAITL